MSATSSTSTNEFVPPSRADQLAPFQRATWLAATPPALSKKPPT
jgi:hypothetical protein